MRINFRSLCCFFEDQFVGLITSRASVGILNLPMGTAIDLLRVENENVLGKEAFFGGDGGSGLGRLSGKRTGFKPDTTHSERIQSES